MLTSDTRDVAACVAEALELVGVGCEIVRITAQTRQIASHLADIVAGIRAAGSNVPVVADIHFKPDAALEAAKWVQKVRVNPGNYADKKKFRSGTTLTTSMPKSWAASWRSSPRWSVFARNAESPCALAPIMAA